MLRVENLVKYYGHVPALNDLSFQIPKGKMFGFVGPNGAGKTTTIKIICGLLKANQGEIYLDDQPMLHNMKGLKSHIGYMPDFFGVYDNLKVLGYLEFYGSIYGIVGKSARTLCYELLELVNLKEKANEYVDDLSRGMKQRLCLARCLVHDPELLVLDEPASGLDPRSRMEMKEILSNLCSREKSILISSHILPELAEMCQYIGIIDSGKMVTSGSVDEIMHQFNFSAPIRIRFVYDMEKGIGVLRQNQYVKNMTKLGNQVAITFEGDEREEAQLLQQLIMSGAGVSGFARNNGDLEALFMQITAHEGGME